MFLKLFQTGQIGNLTIPNRIVMTAMGNHLANPGGGVSEKDIAFYVERAIGGTGLIILEVMTIDYDHGKGNINQISCDHDRFIPGLKRLVSAIHDAGAVVSAQIYHPGRQGIAELNGVESMPAPSALQDKIVKQPTHAMSSEEIDEMVARFAAAARRCKDAGFDAVEIHGAHGYLINQFLSPYTNKRTDEYGGEIANRCRFAKEVIAAIRFEVGSDYPLLFRLSVDEHLEYVGKPKEGIHLAEGVEIARLLEGYGIDALDISCGIYETMNTAWEPISFDESWKIEAPAKVKDSVSIPVIGTSVIRNPGYAEQILIEGKVDFIGSARQFFADPHWANKAKEGRVDDIRRCIQCLYCMETLMEADLTGVTVSCAINYESGRENEYRDALLRKDGNGRVVVVIGAGPSGMEAACVAAKRGYQVIVLEESAQTGGQLNCAAAPPKKSKLRWLIEYQLNIAIKLGVDIRLNTTSSLKDIQALDPYAVIIAQGSTPMTPSSIIGLDQSNVFNAQQVLSGEVVIKDLDVGIVGSGMTGIETAEFLAESNNSIALFEMLDKIGSDMFFQNLADVMSRLNAHNPKIYTKHKLIRIDGRRAYFEVSDSNQVSEFQFDAFILSLGACPNPHLVDEIKSQFKRVFVIGDSKRCGRIEAAISSGYKTGCEI